MISHGLFQIIKAISIDDLRKLKTFIQNANESDSKMNLLLGFVLLKNKSNDSITIDQMFNEVYPNEPFNNNKIRVLMSQLLKKVEDFLVFNAIKNDKVNYQFTLLNAYRKLGANKAFDKQYQKLDKLLQSEVVYSDSHFYQYQQSKQLYWHTIEQRRESDNVFENMLSRLESFDVLEYLKLMCYAISAQVDLKFEKESIALAVLNSVEKTIYRNNVLVQTYYLIYQSFYKNDEEYYFQLQEIIKANNQSFSKEDLRTITLLIINFTIRKYNSGNHEFLKEMFFNYKLGLENDALFSDNGLLSRWTFQNIVSIGLLLNETKWTEGFIREYKDLINAENKSTIYTYNLSKLFYKKKDFKEAILHLQNLDSKDVLEVLNAKSLLLRIYFEESDWEVLDSLLVSFERYISRQKGIGYQKKAFLNLVRFTNRLMKVRNGNQQQLLNFKIRVKKAELLADKHWLLDQVNQMIEKSN